MTPSFWIVVVLTWFSLTNMVHASSIGALACPSGVAAVSGFHLTTSSGQGQPRTIEQIPFLDSGILFTINDFPVEPATSVSVRPIGLYKFSVVAAATIRGNSTNSSISEFRGVLLRVQQGSDGAAVLGPISNESAHILDDAFCEYPAVAITHTNNDFKTEFSGLFTTNSTTPSVVTIDITVVFANNDTSSLYTYQQFLIGVVGEDENSTATSLFPSETPSDASSLVPSSIPSVSEVPSSGPSASLLEPSWMPSEMPMRAPSSSAPIRMSPVTPPVESRTPTVASQATSRAPNAWQHRLRQIYAMQMFWYGFARFFVY